MNQRRTDAVLATAIATAAAACLITACGSTTTTADKPASTSATTSAGAGAATKAPLVIPLTITFAQQKTGLKVDAKDIGRFIIDGVDHERNILDAANWHIAAQCDNLVDGAIRVGVIKSDEMQAIGAAQKGKPIAENSFKTLLDCPND